MLQLLGRWATKINITSKSEDVQLGYSIWNLTKTWEVLLFVTWLKMGDCEESRDDRTGANHCDNNLKSSRHDIFPIMLPKMSTLWRTVRKWFAENLKGRFKRCSSCQMQYSPQLGEKGSPCSGDGSRLAGPSRHPRCSKNGYSWPVDCLNFAGAWYGRAACHLHRTAGPAWQRGGQGHRAGHLTASQRAGGHGLSVGGAGRSPAWAGFASLWRWRDVVTELFWPGLHSPNPSFFFVWVSALKPVLPEPHRSTPTQPMVVCQQASGAPHHSLRANSQFWQNWSP